MDQSEAPLLDALIDYRQSNRYGFTPPGHRQGRGADDRVLEVLGPEPFRDDVLASGGLDDRRTSNKYLKRAEDLMAEAVGADTAFFSTCGSSLSVKAAMMAVAGGFGGSAGSLLVGRDSHKSIVAGLIFSGVQPRWITPRWDAGRHFSHPPSSEQVRQAWDRHPDAAGALIVSPSPYGTCTDLAGIAEVCHERGKPLIVDEAWGAHLPFHEHLPTWAMDAGADVCVVSVHKMGAGFEQGSVFHVQGDLIDRHRLSACADLLMTTSPNVMVYAALDGWRRQMVEHGRQLLGDALELARGVRDDIALIPDVEVLDDELLGVEASHDLDRLQVLIDVSATGTSGYQAADWLREHHHLDVGMSDRRRVLVTCRSPTTKRPLNGCSTGCGRGARRPMASIHHRRSGCRRPTTSNSKASVCPATPFCRGRGGPRRPGRRSHRRRADHAVSTGYPGGGPRRAAQRSRDRLPTLRPAGRHERPRRGRRDAEHVPCAGLTVTPGGVKPSRMPKR